jgi:glycosyltransferase involved in cell wall biosynthesis
MEAMIHKVPVVYTRVGGIPEVMDLGNNGFEAEANNPNSLASDISECINNEILRNEKIKKGYVFVKSNFTKKVMLENFTKICHEVIASTN